MEGGAGGLQEGGNQRIQRSLLGSEEDIPTLILCPPTSRTLEPNLGVTLGGRFLWVQRLRFKVKLFGMVIVKCDVSRDKQDGFSCLVINSLVGLEPRRRLLSA